MNPRNDVPAAWATTTSPHSKREPYTIAVRLKEPRSPFVATFFTMSGNPYPVLPAHY